MANNLQSHLLSVVSNSGTRGMGILAFGSEIVEVINDSRWVLLLLILLVVADFRFGLGESKKRYIEAKRKKDDIRMELYRWHASRAVRRTCNKLIDYIVGMLVGATVGMAVLEPIGISHIYGAYTVAVIAVLCEISSIGGHFLYLRGIKKLRRNSIINFIKSFAIALAKRKNEDLGEALEDAINNEPKKEQ